ncbi:hypothetical protein NM208_g10691 [Fusarium decemcellulare]|uniref:Uncharacterized protein n=1 Tax=Fusarium decemcellulare TaxID=57161 RepID=A0ACC1RX53_9HYPO|nr:hypothetical protein NM208_g10691 [Fusarium decemcellulare]
MAPLHDRSNGLDPQLAWNLAFIAVTIVFGVFVAFLAYVIRCNRSLKRELRTALIPASRINFTPIQWEDMNRYYARCYVKENEQRVEAQRLTETLQQEIEQMRQRNDELKTKNAELETEVAEKEEQNKTLYAHIWPSNDWPSTGGPQPQVVVALPAKVRYAISDSDSDEDLYGSSIQGDDPKSPESQDSPTHSTESTEDEAKNYHQK